MKTLFNAILLTTTAISLSSCAAGSLVSAFAGRADQAESLTPEGEQKLIKRIRSQIVFPQIDIEVHEDVRH